MQKKLYLTNKELLSEIHKSKTRYSRYTKPEYSRYDAITDNVNKLTPKFVKKVLDGIHNPTGRTPPRPDVVEEDLIFRVMTEEHIPLDPLRKRKPKGVAVAHAWTNFPPYKHYILRDGVPVEVGRSHWKGDFETGHFSLESGQITDNLARMYMLLADRYSSRYNWRGYSYVDEMRATSLTHLVRVGLMFNEDRSNNPFAFYTRLLLNCFRSVLKTEKNQQAIRDEMLMASGSLPSFGRQVEDEAGLGSTDIYKTAIRPKAKA